MNDLVLADPTLLSNPVHADYTLQHEEEALIYLWGLTFQARNFGDDDLVCIKVMMPDENGPVLLKRYERTWISNVHVRGMMNTPDGAPGELPAGLILRLELFTFKTDDSVIHVNMDYILTVKQ